MRKWSLVVAAGALVLAACAPGTPDLGYSTQGSVPYGSASGGAAGARSVVPLPDGSVVASRGDQALTRISATGQVDPGWGASLPTDCARTSGASAPGTHIVFTCNRSRPPGNTPTWQVWRVTDGGQLDPGFGGGDGMADLPTSITQLSAAPLPNGGVLGLGFADAPPSLTSAPPLQATAFSASGAVNSTTSIPLTVFPLDGSFDGWHLSSRLVPTPTGATAIEELSTTVTAWNREIGQYRLQHFDASGHATDDPTWTDTGGGNIFGATHVAGVVQLAGGREVQADTRIAFDRQTLAITTTSELQAFGSGRTPDPAFGNDGVVNLDLPGVGRLQPTVILASNDGASLVVAGTDPTGAARLARFDAATGALDTGFGNAGSVGVTLDRVDAGTARAGFDQLYLGGTDSGGRPAVARVWDQANA